MIGHKLEGFNIVDKIRDGSVGEIWLAGKDNKMFALKMLFEAHARNAEKRSRFRREARIAKKLNHRNVIKTHEFYDVDPRPFYVMEHFPSENLKHYISQEPDFLATRKLTILRQICEAIKYIHAQGIVHRDIKPENVLVAPNALIKLIDFSISQTKLARFVGVFGRQAAGSPSYMPPEQIVGRRTDFRSDFYSLGVLAYELFTHRLPYTGTSMQAVFDQHLKASVPSILQVTHGVSPEVDKVVRSLMQKHPKNRPNSLGDIIYVLGKEEVKHTGLEA